MLGKKTKETDDMTTQRPRPQVTADRGTSVIGKEMRIEGDCIVEGSIRIEGRISGSVKAVGLELTESGSVEGDLSAAGEGGRDGRVFTIAGKVDGKVHAPRVDVVSSGSVLRGVEADEAHVRGRVEGGIVARRRLILEETAVVEGDVRAHRLALKEGGQVNGTILMGDRAAQDVSPAAPSRDSSASKTPGSVAAKGATGAAKGDSGGAKDDSESAKSEPGSEKEVLAPAGAEKSES